METGADEVQEWPVAEHDVVAAAAGAGQAVAVGVRDVANPEADVVAALLLHDRDLRRQLLARAACRLELRDGAEAGRSERPRREGLANTGDDPVLAEHDDRHVDARSALPRVLDRDRTLCRLEVLELVRAQDSRRQRDGSVRL